jgi:hypothetical protein
MLTQVLELKGALLYDKLRAMRDNRDGGWSKSLLSGRKVITYVKSPLGFFTLALLIVEGFLLAAGSLFKISESMRLVAMFTGVLLFVAVVATVTVLAIKYPQSLVFSEHSHLQWELLQIHGDKWKPIIDPLARNEAIEQPTKPLGQPDTASESDLGRT